MERLSAPTPLRGSNGVAFGPDGRLYVAEYLAGRISAVDLGTGDVETVVAPDGPIQAPDDLAFGADGAMYVTDLVPGRVWRRDPTGDLSLVAGQIRNPNGIACVGDRLFVAIGPPVRIVAADVPVGPPTRPQPALFAHGLPGVPRPFAGLAAAGDGSVYLAADGEGTILRLIPVENP